MPASTRSQSKPKQTHLEDFETKTVKAKTASNSKAKRTPTSNTKGNTTTSSKRKQPKDDDNDAIEIQPVKKQKQTSLKQEEDVPEAEESKPVIINRAPVLQLWAACVAQHCYPKLSWETHLSIGHAISALCAVSKGRAIGMIDQSSDDPKKKAEKERKKEEAEEAAEDEVTVMGFTLSLEDGSAIVSGKPQKGNEGLLKKKYGDEEAYERVKKVMEEAVEAFEAKAKKGELNKTAFHMYEEFRPNVQSGQGGWGRKGELKLEKIRQIGE